LNQSDIFCGQSCSNELLFGGGNRQISCQQYQASTTIPWHTTTYNSCLQLPHESHSNLCSKGRHRSICLLSHGNMAIAQCGTWQHGSSALRHLAGCIRCTTMHLALPRQHGKSLRNVADGAVPTTCESECPQTRARPAP
jgi:hypothetical protein